jgi:hypothetical protein
MKPALSTSHRQVARLAGEETIEVRILYYQPGVALEVLTRPPQPGLSWAERPLGRRLKLMRFLMDAPITRWVL